MRRYLHPAALPEPPISIHAPQWGATASHIRFLHLPKRISIHAPQWGATSLIHSSSTTSSYFNPRTPVGCDRAPIIKARRARYFNPRTPVGCDLTLNRFVNELILFQSTHPSGVRQARRHQPRRKPCYFNPRTPVGCDDHRVLFHALERISIHAPQWGATTLALPFLMVTVFQSTHPSGVRPTESLLVEPVDRISIHAPQWGATCCS